MIGFATIVPYSQKAIVSPTIFASTVADSTTFTATVYGASYLLTIECLAGNVMVSGTGTAASSSYGWKIPAGENLTFKVRKTDNNPTSRISLFALSTTDVYQAIIWE